MICEHRGAKERNKLALPSAYSEEDTLKGRQDEQGVRLGARTPRKDLQGKVTLP